MVFIMYERFSPHKRFLSSLTPNWLMRSKVISFGAKCCYARLAQYDGENGVCKPRQKVLAEELGCSHTQIRRLLNELIKSRFIEREQIGMGRANRYYFIINHDVPYVDTPTLPPHVDTTPSTYGQTLPPHVDTPIKRINEENHISTSVAQNELITLVTRYSSLRKHIFDTPLQRTFFFKRNVRAAKQLIIESGSIDKALEYLDKADKYFGEDKLSWTLETVLRNIPNILKEKKAKGWGGNYE